MSAVCSVTVARGALYLSHEAYDRYFAGLEAVILLRRADDLWIMPVRHAAAGGYLLKVRNSRGDRVVHAPDFLREQGIDESVASQLSVAWSQECGALIAVAAFSAN
ncbi:hypothetical protein [Bradyrhizobium sp. RDM4]|uniref:hypothetical protein n=1 Tax=Bradyrhizobium sp. RDM4 TaxID=3378765 RepID=UPI0038FC6CFD